MKLSKEGALLFINNSWLWLENVLWAFIKKNWKYILIIILLIVAIFSIKSCNEAKKQLSDNQKAMNFNDSLANSTIRHWRDRNDNLHVEVSKINVEALYMRKYLDSVAKLLKIRPKQIDEVSKTGLIITSTGKLDVDTFFLKVPCEENGKDSAYVASGYDFSWSDKWLSLKGSVGAGRDSFSITGTDTISRVDYWERNWLLGAKTYYSDFQNANPYIKVVNSKGAQFKIKESKWSLGLSLQTGYPLNSTIQLNKPIISAGLSLQYSLIKF